MMTNISAECFFFFSRYGSQDLGVLLIFPHSFVIVSLSLRIESGSGVGAVHLQYQWWSDEQAAGARAVLQLPLWLVLCICCQLIPAQRGQKIKFQFKI